MLHNNVILRARDDRPVLHSSHFEITRLWSARVRRSQILEPVERGDGAYRVQTDDTTDEAAGYLGGQVPPVQGREHDALAIDVFEAEHDAIGRDGVRHDVDGQNH